MHAISRFPLYPCHIASRDELHTAFIRFQKNSFEGSIPSEFGGIQLTELWLHGNTKLTGTIPSEFGKLSNFLTDLRLAQTSMEGTLPESLFSLSRMWRLDLHSNGFSGPIHNVTRFGDMQTLRLNDNQFTGEIPARLGTMSNLVDLRLNGNRLTGSIPSTVCDLQEELRILSTIQADCLPETDVTQGIACECCDLCCDTTGSCQPMGF
jgi:hypothetical protein